MVEWLGVEFTYIYIYKYVLCELYALNVLCVLLYVYVIDHGGTLV